MRVVRGYVARQLQAESGEVARDREAISRLASETASMKAELHKLKTKVGEGDDLSILHFKYWLTGNVPTHQVEFAPSRL